MAVAIDWGNTNTVVAIKGGVSEHIFRINGEPLIPSYLCYSENGVLECIGHEAKNRLREGNSNVVAGIKRLIGVGYSNRIGIWAKRAYGINLIDDGGRITVKIGTIFKSPEQIAIDFFSKIRAMLTEDINERGFLRRLFSGNPNIDECIATCPAHYTDTQQAALKKCINDSGFRLLEDKLIAEPLAPRGLFPLDRNDNTLVIDWGGGTLDFSLTGPQGDCKHLSAIQEEYGGVDMDVSIIKGLISKGELPPDLPADDYAIVREHVEFMKERLLVSATNDPLEKEIVLPCLNKKIMIKITKTDLGAWLEKIVNGAMNGLDNVLGEVQSRYKIGRCFLVGGPTRAPFIRDAIRNILPSRIKIEDMRDPITAVARGALKMGGEDGMLVDDFGICVVQYGLNIGVLLLKSQQRYPIQSREVQMELRGITGQDVKIMVWARKSNRADEQYYYKTSYSYTFIPHFSDDNIAHIKISLSANNRGSISARVIDETTNQQMQLQQIGQDVLRDMHGPPYRSINEGLASMVRDRWNEFRFNALLNAGFLESENPDGRDQDEVTEIEQFLERRMWNAKRDSVRDLQNLIQRSRNAALNIGGDWGGQDNEIITIIHDLDGYAEGIRAEDINVVTRILDRLYEKLIEQNANVELIPALECIAIGEMHETFRASINSFRDIITGFSKNRYERMAAKLSELRSMVALDSERNERILNEFNFIEVIIGLHHTLRFIERFGS